MARIDLPSLQQRLAQQQPKSPTLVPAEPASRSTRSAPAPAGTLRATTTMRAALPLKATNARAERVEERARANALRAQIDELNAEIAVTRAEADRALAEERQRSDGLSERVHTLQTEIRETEARAERTDADRRAAEARLEAERRRADELRATINELRAGQATMIDMHARELAVAQHDALAARQAAAALRQVEAERKGRGRLARLRAAWRGEGRF